MAEITRIRKTPVQEFFAELLHAATSAHMLHLQASSFSVHMAMDEVYKELPGLVDELIEAYQGKNGRVQNYPSEFSAPTKPVEFIDEMLHCLKRDRQCVGPDSELQNIIDEITSLFDSASYKVRFLQ